MLVEYTPTTQESKPSRKSQCTTSAFSLVQESSCFNMLLMMPIAHSCGSVLTPASTITAGVPFPTVTIAQSAVPWSTLTSWEHVNEITHAIHAWKALKSMSGTLCPVASAMMRRNAEANTPLGEWVQFSLTSLGDFNHGKLQKNVLHLSKEIPVKSNCVALRDPYKQTIQPPRVWLIYFFFLFCFVNLHCYFCINQNNSYLLHKKQLFIYFNISQQHCSHFLLLIGMQILHLYW